MGLRLVGYSVEDFDVIYYTFVSDIEDSPFNAPDGIIIPKSTLSSLASIPLPYIKLAL